MTCEEHLEAVPSIFLSGSRRWVLKVLYHRAPHILHALCSVILRFQHCQQGILPLATCKGWTCPIRIPRTCERQWGNDRQSLFRASWEEGGSIICVGVFHTLASRATHKRSLQVHVCWCPPFCSFHFPSNQQLLFSLPVPTDRRAIFKYGYDSACMCRLSIQAWTDTEIKHEDVPLLPIVPFCFQYWPHFSYTCALCTRQYCLMLTMKGHYPIDRSRLASDSVLLACAYTWLYAASESDFKTEFACWEDWGFGLCCGVGAIRSASAEALSFSVGNPDHYLWTQ